MSRTKHHRNQRKNRIGYDFGGRYNCNKGYGNHYSKYGRKLAASERRNATKRIVNNEVGQV